MKLYDYMMLKERDQIFALVRKGEHISTLNNGATFFQLYSLNTFFVELEYEKWTWKLVGRSIFPTGLQMEKYLPENPLTI